jgi:pyrimidine-nucleoside phosphorylase
MLTDMDAPLGRAIGNALEIAECIDTLQGQGPPALREVVVRMAARMVVLGGGAAGEAAARVEQALASGQALQTFVRLIEAHGGNPRIVDDRRLLASAPDREMCRAPQSGYVSRLAAGALGRASNALGAGRVTAADEVDHGVGIMLLAGPGTPVAAGDPVLELHHRGGRGLDAALAFCRAAIAVGERPPDPRPKVLAEIR